MNAEDLSRFEEGKSGRGLWIRCCGREQPASQKLLGVVAVVTSLVAGTKPDVDNVNTICMNDGEGASTRVRTLVARTMTELYAQADLLEAAFLEKCSRPFLQMR